MNKDLASLEPVIEFPPVGRRRFLQTVGTGIVVAILEPGIAQAADRLPSAYLRIAEDGTITLYSAKIEMGQGIMTSLAQMAAEELDAPLSVMRVEMGDTGTCPADPDGGTWGSLTTRGAFGAAVRSASARARAILVQLAANQLGLAPDQLMTRDGYVISLADESRRLSYAALAGGKNVEVTLSQSPKVQPRSQFTLSGMPTLRLDGRDKVTGKARYTADIQVPGMLYARIVRPPARNARLLSIDTTEAEKVPGAIVKRVGASYVVLHEKPDLAARALALVKADYELPATGPDDTTIHSYLLARSPAASTLEIRGSIVTGEQLATTRYEQTYYTPYIAHVPMEPHAAVAVPEGTRLTVYASTQTPSGTQSDTGAFRVITPFVGGGFGGKAVNIQAVEAAQIARAVGKPVQVAWTREEEFTYDAFQCPSITKIRAGLDRDGKIAFWDYQVYFVGERGAPVLYDLPHLRTRVYGNYSDAVPFASGPWRAPGNSANTFARESHFSQLASLAGVDAVEFRLRHLKNARLRNTLERAAEAFSWVPAASPSGRGYGVACGEDAGSYVVMMAEVEVNLLSGAIRVRRMLCAQDCGQVINPEGARMQIEGCMMMGLGYALREELHFSKGRIGDTNFNSYAIPRFSWMPRLETVLVQNDTLGPQGGGEPAIITVGAAVANAVQDAVGIRLNRLPMTPERVLAAIEAMPLTVDAVAQEGNYVRISWKGRPEVRLQRTDTLSNPIWEDVPDSAGESRVTLPATPASGFFRLVRTPAGP